MFKNIIAPVQAWLMSQGMCVGCGKPLKNGRRKRNGASEIVTCKSCGRVFLYNRQKHTYTRAPLGTHG